ncbi:polyprenyl synthetase family protein [Streptomyces sp. ID05-39B]|uniref:polyprenyl synthetase family protein n=1 Tax=Streptomyces sp. ID05-39B TaxID=3028664 RepID=UPI0029BA8527|nr:polyprenyl synthetase family protein [Streptomyces sp. ID05-39B]MDX3525556.1 polyprenyl synthetase family protein [Streptomyces sp. ID05-39B]
MTDAAVLTTHIQARLAGYENHFSTLFKEYFHALGTDLEVPSFSRFTPECLHLLRDLSLRGGKRMRVALVYEAARLVTTEPVEAVDEAALSVELLQTHGLIHDDIIDDSPTRRGGPSTYYAYRRNFPAHPQAALGLAILAGDLALALSLRVLLESEAPPAIRQAMVEAQTRAASDTFVGQIIDLERDFSPNTDEEVLHCVADYKTARYSVLAPMQLGLLAAGEQPAPFEEELRRYARLVGIGGQMRDDYLDLFGDAQVMGKPMGADIRGGRRSYTVHAILSATTDAEKAVVESALGDPNCTEETIGAVREIAELRGVPARMRSEMQRYAELASTGAADWRSRWRPEAVAFFEHLPQWAMERIR